MARQLLRFGGVPEHFNYPVRLAAKAARPFFSWKEYGGGSVTGRSGKERAQTLLKLGRIVPAVQRLENRRILTLVEPSMPICARRSLACASSALI